MAYALPAERCRDGAGVVQQDVGRDQPNHVSHFCCAKSKYLGSCSINSTVCRALFITLACGVSGGDVVTASVYFDTDWKVYCCQVTVTPTTVCTSNSMLTIVLVIVLGILLAILLVSKSISKGIF